MVTDPISDFLTRIRNAQQANHRVVEIPSSNVKQRITEILFNQGYILKYKFEDTENHQGKITIALKYDSKNKVPVIRKMARVSRPGLRTYVRHKNLPRVINGLGLTIVSTSQGVMSEKEARLKKIGGEVLCYIY